MKMIKTIQQAKDDATEKYGEHSQKEHLAHLTLDGIHRGLEQLSGLGLPLRLSDEVAPEYVQRFPMVLHDGRGGNLEVGNEHEYDDGIAKGWRDLTLPATARDVTQDPDDSVVHPVDAHTLDPADDYDRGGDEHGPDVDDAPTHADEE